MNLVYPSQDCLLLQNLLPDLNLKPCLFELSTKKLYDKILYVGLGKTLFCKVKAEKHLCKHSKNNIFSMEDNNIHLWQIEDSIPNAKVFLFQNGWRDNVFFKKFAKYKQNIIKVSKYFAQGHALKNNFNIQNRQKIIVSGNIKNNYFDTLKQNKKSILFISQFFPQKKIPLDQQAYSNDDFFYKVDRLVLSTCMAFAKHVQAELFILGRPSGIAKFEILEEKYYNKIAPNVKVVRRNDESFCYTEIGKHELIVSVDSNLAYEAASKGIKTCFFPLRSSLLNLSDRKFGFPQPFPETGFCWSNRFDINKIMKILSDNFNSTKESYSKRLKEIKFSDVIIYDPANSIIKEELCNIK